MSFLHPEFLYFMLPPLFILFGFLLTQKEAEGHFFSDEVMSRLRVSANTLTLKARNALFLLMGFFIVIALAGPVINDGIIEVKAKSADVMIAFDISDSMLAQDVYPSRLKLAKVKAIELLKNAPEKRIGVIAFAKNSYLVSPMSFDHNAVNFLLKQLNTNSITEKGTDLLSLLEVVDKTIKHKSKKYLLIISDGGDKTDFAKEIAFAKEKNIVVFVLGIGTTKGAPIKLSDGSFIKHNGEIIVSKLNENISELATKSGGVYIQSVKSDKDIKTMLSEIEKNSEQKELKSEKIHKFIPLFYYPVAMALLILLIATSSISKRERLKMPASMFLLFVFIFTPSHVKAGFLDFVELKEAKEAYKTGDYEKAAKLYSKHANSTQNAQSYFNAGNSFYKHKKYKEAVSLYKKAVFDRKEYKAKKWANIGNSYAKQETQESLQKAKKAYEESLKLQEDKEIRENLELVKKALKEQEQKNKQNKEDKNKDKKGDKKKNSKDKNKSDKENKKNTKNKKEESSDGEKSDEKKEKKSEDKDRKNKDEKSKNQEKSEVRKDKKKDELKKLKKNEDNKTNESSSGKPQVNNQEVMSEAEEKKWIDHLNTQQNTYMYKLNNNKQKESDINEKPW